MPSSKPPYRPPLMSEVRAVAPNGLVVASTFAGAGGSSTGYRMAGFRVAYANEFVPAARDTYAANMAPGTVLDGQDIRDVTPESILAQLGLAAGELDVLDGSPPCASFSTAGKRQAKWGKLSAYSDTAQRSDDLFFEFARILAGTQPRVFVAENVSGLVKGAAKGYFKLILARLEAAGYRVSARLLDAQWLGVPQSRQRVIFIGVRADLPARPAHPRPLPYRYSLREVLAGVTAHEDMDVTALTGGSFPAPAGAGHPAPTIKTTSGHYQVAEPAVITRTGDQFLYERRRIDDAAPTMLTDPTNYVTDNAVPDVWAPDGKAYDPETGAVISLNPDTKLAREARQLLAGRASYFNLTRPSLHGPSPTVTAAGGVIGLASVVHPVTLRKFTLGELRAICGFPPDYALTGTYEQRWERLGRSVPPLMMRAIAETLRDEVLPACAG